MFDARKTMELQNLHGIENFKKLTIPQMLERTKLIELLREVQYLGGLEEKIADHLIANGVTIPVKCKECRYYTEDDEYCGFWGECRHPEHFCDEGVSDNEKL